MLFLSTIGTHVISLHYRNTCYLSPLYGHMLFLSTIRTHVISLHYTDTCYFSPLYGTHVISLHYRNTCYFSPLYGHMLFLSTIRTHVISLHYRNTCYFSHVTAWVTNRQVITSSHILSASEMAPCSFHGPWSKVVHYIGNRVPFGTK
jgi:hypothetical protein